MFPFASLLITLHLACYIAATPVEVRTSHVTLSLAKQITTSGGVMKLLEHDQARAAALMNRGDALQGKLNQRNGNTPDTNIGVSYIAAVAIGNPATTCMLLIFNRLPQLTRTCR